MCGCESRARAFASRWKRATVLSSLTRRAGSTLTATRRSSVRSRRLVNRAHAAFAQLFQDLVAAGEQDGVVGPGGRLLPGVRGNNVILQPGHSQRIDRGPFARPGQRFSGEAFVILRLGRLACLAAIMNIEQDQFMEQGAIGKVGRWAQVVFDARWRTGFPGSLETTAHLLHAIGLSRRQFRKKAKGGLHGILTNRVVVPYSLPV